MRASAPRWGLVSGGPDGISSVIARAASMEAVVLISSRPFSSSIETIVADFLRARIDGIAGRHLVMLLRKSIGVDLAFLDLLRRDVFAQNESRDRFSIELEQSIDVFAAIEVGPPLRLRFPPVISQEAAEQISSASILPHEPVLFFGFRHQHVGEQRSLELAALRFLGLGPGAILRRSERTERKIDAKLRSRFEATGQ